MGLTTGAGASKMLRRTRCARDRHRNGYPQRNAVALSPPGGGDVMAHRNMTAALPALLDYPFAAPPEPGAVTAVAPNVFWLRMPLPFALDHINLWVIEEAAGWVLVDCGVGTEATR